MGTVTALHQPASHVFWGEMWPCNHVVQVYGDDAVFLDALEGFVGSALRDGESAIVIATAGHLYSFEKRMRDHGIDVGRAKEEHRYVTDLAEEILDRFMVDGWPDEALFLKTVKQLMAVARGDSRRKVRAFGEMVAVLWARGEYAATIHLELLWSKLCDGENFPVFCAYPRDGFARNAVESIVEICRTHSKVIP